jgi:GNAT superfamily N-acetyltransferase
MTDTATADRPEAPPSDSPIHLTTWTGFEFTVRSARPEDEALLGEFFTRVSPEDRHFRFLSGVEKVGHSFLERLTQVDHDRTEDFLAFVGDTLIASAMMASDDAKERAEVAISVRADYKHRGVGWTLLEFTARQAAARGIGIIESIESRDNGEAISLEKEMGFTAMAFPGDPCLVLLQKQTG